METINTINVGGIDNEIEDTVARNTNTTQDSQIQTLTSNLATTNSNLSSEVSERASADALINTRIDQIIAPSGEAPSAAEVADARIGADNVTYPTLGDANRTQITKGIKSSNGIHATEEVTSFKKLICDGAYVARNENPSASDASKVGVERTGNRLILNGTMPDGTYGYMYVKLSGNELSRTIYSSTVENWASPIQLIEGHFYQARLKRIDGGDITGLGLSLYKPGSASSVGKSYRLGNMFIKEYIADSTDYHVALTIKREDTPRAFANLELVFELIDLTERSLLGAQERIFTIWNNRIGSIYVDGDDLVISKDGFCIKYLEQPYYIAPTDRETITRISGTRGDVRILLIDTTKLINPGGRQEPSDVLSIVDGSPYRYNINFIPMAIWYKSYWDFISPFDYFNEQNMINKIVKNHVQINSSLVQNNIISHRGTSGTSEYDDNTLQAFEEAINIKGYKIVECDTRFTSDNVIILSHDASISSGGNSYIIADNTYSYLKSVYPSLTTLNELLLLCKKKNACCEIDMKIQNEDSVTSHYELVRKMNMLGSTVFTCTKDIASIFIELGKNAIFSVTQINSVELAREVSHIAELSLLCICSTPKANITRELIETIHEIGAFSKIWTVDSLTEANSFFDDGGDLIITNSILPSQIE